MLTNIYNTGVDGSEDLETSIAEQEILTSGVKYVNFNLFNDQSCHISINGGNYIFLRATQGINIPVVYSAKIQENGITFNWNGVVL